MAMVRKAYNIRGGDTMYTTLHVLVHQNDDGYWAEVPMLGGCFTQGNSLDEIKERMPEAVACWYEDPSAEKIPLAYEILPFEVYDA